MEKFYFGKYILVFLFFVLTLRDLTLVMNPYIITNNTNKYFLFSTLKLIINNVSFINSILPISSPVYKIHVHLLFVSFFSTMSLKKNLVFRIYHIHELMFCFSSRIFKITVLSKRYDYFSVSIEILVIFLSILLIFVTIVLADQSKCVNIFCCIQKCVRIQRNSYMMRVSKQFLFCFN